MRVRDEDLFEERAGAWNGRNNWCKPVQEIRTIIFFLKKKSRRESWMDEWTARTREASALPGGRAGLHSRETTRNGQRGPARPYCMYLAWTTNRSWYGSCRQKEERQKRQGTLVPHTGILWSLSQVTWFAAPPCAFPLENMSMGESQPRASRFQQVPPRVRYVLSLPVFYLSTSPLPLPPPSPLPVFPPGIQAYEVPIISARGWGGGVYIT